MKSYFTFSKSQKIGVVTISIIIFIQIIVLNTNNSVGIPDPFIVDKSQYLIEEETYKSYANNKDEVNSSLVYYDFDPNKLSVNEWIDFGFSEKQAKTIVSYKTKIGGFKKKSDLKKVYVISESKYLELEPYIHISLNTQPLNIADIEEEGTTPAEILLIELNVASTNELVKIKGVGDYTAKGIIKYRDMIGGFHSVNQLKEVYGISDENYELIKPQVEINRSNILKLNVNQLSISELKNHPYISWNVAKAIIDEKFKTTIVDLNFLVDNNHLSQEELNRLLPYIEF